MTGQDAVQVLRALDAPLVGAQEGLRGALTVVTALHGGTRLPPERFVAVIALLTQALARFDDTRAMVFDLLSDVDDGA